MSTEREPNIVIPQPTERETVERLRAENEAVLQSIGRMGAQIQPLDVLRIQFGALVEFMLGTEDDPRRVAFELYWSQALALILANIESQVARAKLTQGVPPANGQILLPNR